ncbi:MAG: hypothetical protein ACN4GR_05640 [Arenicellales bacterium]
MRSQFYISGQSARKLLFVVIFVEICLVVGFLFISFLGEPSPVLYTIFNLSGEKNVPALFSSVQLLLVGIVFLSIAYQTKQQNYPSPLFFAILGAGFIFLSFDEFFSVHERITRMFVHNKMVPRFKGDHGIWVAPYLFIGLVFFISTYGKFVAMWNKFRNETTLMAAGFMIFLAGAVGMEVIGYQYLMDESSPRYLYKLEVAIEEFLEMMGISIVLYGAILLHQAKAP